MPITQTTTADAMAACEAVAEIHRFKVSDLAVSTIAAQIKRYPMAVIREAISLSVNAEFYSLAKFAADVNAVALRRTRSPKAVPCPPGIEATAWREATSIAALHCPANEDFGRFTMALVEEQAAIGSARQPALASGPVALPNLAYDR